MTALHWVSEPFYVKIYLLFLLVVVLIGAFRVIRSRRTRSSPFLRDLAALTLLVSATTACYGTVSILTGRLLEHSNTTPIAVLQKEAVASLISRITLGLIVAIGLYAAGLACERLSKEDGN